MAIPQRSRTSDCGIRDHARPALVRAYVRVVGTVPILLDGTDLPPCDRPRRRCPPHPRTTHRHGHADCRRALASADLHHLSSGTQSEPLVQPRGCSPSAHVADRGLHADRTGGDRSRRYTRAPMGRTDYGTRHLSRSDPLLSWSLRQGVWSALAVVHAAHPDPMGGSRLGPPVPDRAGAIRALLARAPPQAQGSDGLGAAGAASDRTVASGPAPHRRCGYELRCHRNAAPGRERVCMITRLRLDARLFAPPAPRKPGTIGRPRIVGERLPTLAECLADPKTPWRRLRVDRWYGGGERIVEIISGTGDRGHLCGDAAPSRSGVKGCASSSTLRTRPSVRSRNHNVAVVAMFG